MPCARDTASTLLAGLDEDVLEYLVTMLEGDEEQEAMEATVAEFLLSTEHVATEEEATAKCRELFAALSCAGAADAAETAAAPEPELKALEQKTSIAESDSHLFRDVSKDELGGRLVDLDEALEVRRKRKARQEAELRAVRAAHSRVLAQRAAEDAALAAATTAAVVEAGGVSLEGVIVDSGRKEVEFELSSLQLEHAKTTKSGWPATDAAALRELAGRPSEDPPVFGSAYGAFGGGEVGEEACRALEALCQMGAIDTMLSNFILPLQDLADGTSRIHCSLNLNTETGRLSSRTPNLQNQPALEKDKYLIRDAFVAAPGKALVVADYGQLELRLLAHMTACTSMVEAFKLGGDFHSRTAMGMFDHVRRAVEEGTCLLDWDYSQGEPPTPLLKDLFGSERRRAKTLNFSIAYGKTAHGLSKDWGVSIDEAKEMLRAWYADRPEVLQWQKDTIASARATGATRTLLGRYRTLPGIQGRNGAVRAHMERAAINTPIQGGAADIMTLAMIKLQRSEKLREMGFRNLLQVHDEVLFEGPAELADEARAEVVACMERPFDENLPSLLVDLVVDANTASTWYEAK
mmetsp:Transcript_4739/g.15387  ORF Transcript_4739/g.15387 Transcript_4739/m.15387 type:complete len:578 (-) Transcript_4739:131-1864(-)